MVDILAQANQHSVETPVSGAGELRAAQAFRSSAQGLAGGIESLDDEYTLYQAEQALDSLDQLALNTASTLYNTNASLSGKVSGPKAQAAALQFHSKIGRLAASNPRVAAQVRAIGTYGAKNNPILTAQAAVQKAQDVERAKVQVEGTQLAINEGHANPTAAQAYDAYMSDQKRKHIQDIAKGEAELATNLATTADEKQNAGVSSILVDMSQKSTATFEMFLQTVKGGKAEAEVRLSNSLTGESVVDFSKFKTEEQFETAMRELYIQDLIELKNEASARVFKSKVPGADFKAAQEDLDAYIKGVDGQITSLKNKDLADMLKNSGSILESRIYNDHMSDPETAHRITLLKHVPGLTDTVKGKQFASKAMDRVELRIAAIKNTAPPGEHNETDEEKKAKAEALKSAAKVATTGELKEATPEKKQAVTDYAVGIIDKFVKDVVDVATASVDTVTHFVDLLTGVDPSGTDKEDSYPMKAEEGLQKLLSDKVVPDLKRLLAPLKTGTSTMVDVMNWIGVTPITTQSDVDPRKAIELDVDSAGRISMSMGELTPEQEVHRTDLEGIITDFNTQARTISKIMQYTADKKGISVEEATQTFLQDNFSIKEGTSVIEEGTSSSPIFNQIIQMSTETLREVVSGVTAAGGEAAPFFRESVSETLKQQAKDFAAAELARREAPSGGFVFDPQKGFVNE